jgi:predicted DNA-binding protein
MPRNRAGAQQAIHAPPELLERLRAAAAARRQTVTAVVVEAIEAALSSGLHHPNKSGTSTKGLH